MELLYSGSLNFTLLSPDSEFRNADGIRLRFFPRKRDFSMNSVTRKTFLKVQLFWHGICLAWYMFGLILWNDHDVEMHFCSTSEKALLKILTESKNVVLYT